MAFRTVQQALKEKQHKLKKLLEIPDEEKKADHAQDMQDRLMDYLRQTGARLKIDKIKRVGLKPFSFPSRTHCRHSVELKIRDYNVLQLCDLASSKEKQGKNRKL